MTLAERARAARGAAIELGALGTEAKNAILTAIARGLEARADEIVSANREDLAAAESDRLAAPLAKRLRFDRAKVAETAHGLASLVCLYQVSCPIGVVGVIFESRPDALVQIATLCLKSGNAVLLKGGSEAARTNRVLAQVIAEAAREPLARAGFSPAESGSWIQLLETREDVRGLLGLDGLVDLVIPRGSNEFVRFIMDNTTIPVLGHADGICHLYVHGDAEVEMAVRLAVDAKTQYVAVCNAIETLLVHQDVAAAFLPAARVALQAKGVELRGCPATRRVIDCAPASEADWSTEYLDLKLSVRVVASLDEAVQHVNRYGSHHTDAVVARSAQAAERFMALVDSAGVYWNASTRFADGYRYGLGAEVGVSTSKIHARGPVGLGGLVSYKWRLYGTGQTVAPYGSGERPFRHRDLPARLPGAGE
jgi:glutamate-5-semialdehyde dehydrogenase